MPGWETILFDVQAMDIEIATLQAQLSAQPAQLEAIKKRFAALKAELEAAQKTVQDTQLAIRKTEGEINDLHTRKKDFQTKSAIIRNNDEYKAALIQIELCDKTVSELESKQLTLMDALEEAKANLAFVNEKIAKAKQEGSAELDEMEKCQAAAKAQISQLQSQRDAIAADLPADIASRYNRLRNAPNQNKQQAVFVSIAGGNCGRCKMKLTQQTIADVRKGNTACCTYCGAILYDDKQA